MRIVQLTEASLSRVWQHIDNSNRPVAILTAFRGERDLEDNIAYNRALAGAVRNMGYGYFYLVGYYVENKDKPNETRLREDAVFVVGSKDKDDQYLENFRVRICNLGKKYNQESVLIVDQNGVGNFYDTNGNLVPPTETWKTQNLKLSPGKLGKAYSHLRGRPDRTFVFEKEQDGNSFFSRNNY